jgi:hypothetical protein
MAFLGVLIFFSLSFLHWRFYFHTAWRCIIALSHYRIYRISEEGGVLSLIITRTRRMEDTLLARSQMKTQHMSIRIGRERTHIHIILISNNAKYGYKVLCHLPFLTTPMYANCDGIRRLSMQHRAHISSLLLRACLQPVHRLFTHPFHPSHPASQ